MSLTRRHYLALSAALRHARGVELPPATSPTQAARLQHRACAEAVAGVLAAPGFDEDRFLGDSGVTPGVRLDVCDRPWTEFEQHTRR